MKFQIILANILIIIKLSLTQPNSQNCVSYLNGKCTKCYSGYNLVQGYCMLVCTANCSLCLSSNKCLQCIPGYYLSTSGNQCIKCSDPCTNCVLNQNTYVCTKCNNLDWDGSTCTATNKTQPYCLNNNSSLCPTCGNYCKTCFYNQLKQNICSSCVDNASFNNTKISSCGCNAGYTGIQNKCISCQDLFGKYCTSCNATNCLSCFSRNGCVLFSNQNVCLCDSKLTSKYNQIYQLNHVIWV